MTPKFVKNISGQTGTWFGQDIDNNTYYEIQAIELTQWQTGTDLIDSINSDDIVLAKTNDGLNDLNKADSLTFLQECPFDH